MVTQKIMFSPCMVCDNEEMYDWFLLDETLDFIDKYLECGLDSIETSIFHMNSWYTPPAFNLSMYNLFTTNIFPKLDKLLRKGNEYLLADLSSNCTSFIQNPDYVMTNPQEIELIKAYTECINQNYVLFIGKPNYDLKGETLDIKTDDGVVLIPVVKDPYIEKTPAYNSFIKANLSTGPFPNSELCVKLDEQMHDEAKNIAGLKGSLYKQYGEIIALRNGFCEYHPKNPYNKDTKYFISADKKYLISIDLLHGLFEVFEGNASKQWVAEYNFSGKLLSSDQMSQKELAEMRHNHKVEADKK